MYIHVSVYQQKDAKMRSVLFLTAAATRKIMTSGLTAFNDFWYQITISKPLKRLPIIFQVAVLDWLLATLTHTHTHTHIYI